MDKPDSRVVHLVNFNGHTGMRSANRRAVEEIVPLHALRVSVAIAAGRRCASVELAFAKAPVPFEARDGFATFTIPRMEEFESVLVTYDPSRTA